MIFLDTLSHVNVAIIVTLSLFARKEEVEVLIIREIMWLIIIIIRSRIIINKNCNIRII